MVAMSSKESASKSLKELTKQPKKTMSKTSRVQSQPAKKT